MTCLAIPKILGISWWWLVVISAFEYYIRYLLHVPLWVPSVTELLFLGQALWLRFAEPKSIAIFLYLVWFALSIPIDVVTSRSNHLNPLGWLFSFALFAAEMAGIFRFRYEMMRHFNETDPRGLELSGIMTFFFNLLYFQYWFHQLYLEQQQIAVDKTVDGAA